MKIIVKDIGFMYMDTLPCFTLMCLSIGTPKNNKFSICSKFFPLTLLHSETSKLYTFLDSQSAIGLKVDHLSRRVTKLKEAHLFPMKVSPFTLTLSSDSSHKHF